MTARLLPALLALALAGCIGAPEKPPARLLTLPATARAASAAPASVRAPLIVLAPAVPRLLATDRLLVETAEGAAYLKGARWADEPARLFADLLAETLAARGDRIVIDRRNASLAHGARLAGRLSAFGLDAEAREAVLVYDALLVSGATAPPRARRFAARIATPRETPEAVAAALAEAANRVAVEVADWVAE